MTLIRVLTIAACALSVFNGHAFAQSRSNVQVPNEFPPASFTGRQYVDSRGCVYIRAGIDGQTSWIPRMSRSRKVLCGFQPSLSPAQAQAAAAAPRAEPAPQVKQITVPQEPRPAQAASGTQTRTAAAQPQTVRRAAPAAPQRQTQPQAVRRSAPAQAPAQVTVIRPAPEPRPAAAAPAPKPVTTRQASGTKTVTVRQASAAPAPAPGEPACEGASAISSQYLRARPGFAVRCGPQDQPYSTVISGGGGTGPAMRTVRTVQAPAPVALARPAPVTVAAQPAPARVITSQTRVVPKHVYKEQVNATGLHVPEGYQPVWEDDRLNPYRAHQTFAGMAQTDVLWTRTVPRRLIERSTGREVTYRYPGLQYPYTSFEEQRAAGVTVATSGVVMQEPITVKRGRDGQIRQVASAAPLASRQGQGQTQPQPVFAFRAPEPAASAPTVSTRAAPKAVKPASHRYVQVGIFADAAQGKRAARTLAQKGLPAKTGTLNRNGKAYTLVVAGPFGSQSQLNSALSRTRAAGYTGATLRK